MVPIVTAPVLSKPVPVARSASIFAVTVKFPPTEADPVIPVVVPTVTAPVLSKPVPEARSASILAVTAKFPPIVARPETVVVPVTSIVSPPS